MSLSDPHLLALLSELVLTVAWVQIQADDSRRHQSCSSLQPSWLFPDICICRPQARTADPTAQWMTLTCLDWMISPRKQITDKSQIFLISHRLGPQCGLITIPLGICKILSNKSLNIPHYCSVASVPPNLESKSGSNSSRFLPLLLPPPRLKALSAIGKTWAGFSPY